MMTVIMYACATSVVAVSGARTGIKRMQAKGVGKVSFTIISVREECKQTIEFAREDGIVSGDSDLTGECARCLADGAGGSRAEPRTSCGDGMTGTGAEP